MQPKTLDAMLDELVKKFNVSEDSVIFIRRALPTTENAINEMKDEKRGGFGGGREVSLCSNEVLSFSMSRLWDLRVDDDDDDDVFDECASKSSSLTSKS